MPAKIIKVLLVDDHQLVRKGLKMIMESEKNIKVIDEAEDGSEAIIKTVKLRPDVVVMDINMPELNGLDSLKKMRDMGINSRVIIITGKPSKDSIITATKMGAKGYLSKNADPEVMVKAILDVSRGRSYLDLKVASLLTQNDKDESHDFITEKIQNLSKREYEVLILLSEGHNNKTIGEELFISEKTVKNHITKIFKKLEVNDRVQAALFAYNNINR